MSETRIVFDGDCGICSAIVDAGRRWSARRDVTFVPARALAAGERAAYVGQTSDDVFDRSLLFVVDGRVTIGAHGINAALAFLFPRFVPLVAIVDRITPLVAVEDAAYRLFARHRRTLSRIFGFTRCAIR